MTRVYSFAYLLTKCDIVVYDSVLIFDLFITANIFTYLYGNEYVQSLNLLLKQILFIFIFFLIIIGSISYGYIRNISLIQYKNESIDVIEPEQHEIIIHPQISAVSSTEKEIIDCCEIQSEVLSIEKISTPSLRQLICYCDGSYSFKTRIGYSGFRASNGFNKYRRCPLRRPHSGSTESEVFAAYLALQYTARYQYDALILYTDNSKVEQLLKQPKTKDYCDYPELFQALKQCYEENQHFQIRVEHVRGHTTWFEQQECLIKREFAKVDQRVRQRRQRYEYKYNFSNKILNQSHMTYFYQYDRRYIQSIYPEKFGPTFIITSSY